LKQQLLKVNFYNEIILSMKLEIVEIKLKLKESILTDEQLASDSVNSCSLLLLKDIEIKFLMSHRPNRTSSI
jgi:hypothetical protein